MSVGAIALVLPVVSTQAMSAVDAGRLSKSWQALLP